MILPAVVFALMAALVHFYIFYLEVAAYGSERFCRIFGVSEQNVPVLRAAFNNLGVYNLALAVMLLLGSLLALATTGAGRVFALGVLVSALFVVSVAGAYLAMSAPDQRKAALIQMLPATLGLICLVLV